MIGQQIGHYEILEELGRGGMGEVYRARDSRLKRSVAIKILHSELAGEPENWLRFQREARAIAALDHPNIVTVHSIETHPAGDGQECHFITMQLVEGRTLSKWIPRGGCSLREFFDIAIPLVDALATAHSGNVVHRDLKPSNIMISSDGRPRILDFGLAKLRDEGRSRQVRSESFGEGDLTDLTEEGRILGTTHYMSPEQAEGRSLDGRTDLFSLGVIFHEMLTGEKPFVGQTPVAVIASIVKDVPKDVADLNPGLPSQLSRIIKRALEKDPDQRYQTADELRNELRLLRDKDRSEMSGVPQICRTYTWIQVFFAACVIGITVVILAAVVWLPLKEGDRPAEMTRAVPLTSMEGYELDPALSPEGNHVAFVWNSDPGSSLDLYVKLMGSGEPLRLTGSAGDDRHPVWSPDGQEIAFLRESEGTGYEIRLISALGGAERTLGTSPRVGFPGMDWSPDGLTLALVSRETASEGEAIFLLRIASGKLQRLTELPSGGQGDRLPTFSPDGHSLAFVRWFEAQVNEVWVISMNGGEPEKLIDYRGVIRGLDWLADGSGLVFAGKSQGSTGLWRISKNGEMSQQLFGEDATNLSIEGSRLVYSQQLSRSNIWRIAGPATEEAPPPERLISSTRDDWGPCYSPDGTKIAFVSERAGKAQVWLCESEGENCSQVVTEGEAVMPRWAPDSKRLAISMEVEGNSDVYLLDPASVLRPRRLTSDRSLDGPSGWSRDGRWIYFFSDRTGDYQVWKVSPEGGTPVQVTQNGGLLGQEGGDGYLYFLKMTEPCSIWRLPVGRKEDTSLGESADREEKILQDSGLGISGFTLWDDYLLYPLEREAGRSIIQSLNRQTSDIRTLVASGDAVRLAKYGRLSVSPDGRWITFPQLEGLGADLILLENLQ